MKRSIFAALALVLAVAGTIACDNGGTTSTTTAPTTTTTDVLSGTVQANGTAFNTFTVAASGGNVTVTLTSATETLPGGAAPETNVVVGLNIGAPSNGACVPSGSPTLASASSSPVFGGSSVTAGSYCVLVSNLFSDNLGPISYILAVSHS